MLLKRVMLRRAMAQAVEQGNLKPSQRKAIEKLLVTGGRPFKAFAEAMDHIAEQKVGAQKAKALGDGTLLKLILDNLDEIVAAILAILKAFNI